MRYRVAEETVALLVVCDEWVVCNLDRCGAPLEDWFEQQLPHIEWIRRRRCFSRGIRVWKICITHFCEYAEKISDAVRNNGICPAHLFGQALAQVGDSNLSG